MTLRRNRPIAASRPGTIALKISNPDELFHAFDPSPLVGRDLNGQVEAFIVESALELPERSYRLLIHLPRGISMDDNQTIAAALRSYFAYRSTVHARRIRLLLREGRRALVMGMAFLILCSGLGFGATQTIAAPLGAFLQEGLLIVGWVAMWRPVEMFLYDWQPMQRERAVLDALATMEIQFVHD